MCVEFPFRYVASLEKTQYFCTAVVWLGAGWPEGPIQNYQFGRGLPDCSLPSQKVRLTESQQRPRAPWTFLACTDFPEIAILRGVFEGSAHQVP